MMQGLRFISEGVVATIIVLIVIVISVRVVNGFWVWNLSSTPTTTITEETDRFWRSIYENNSETELGYKPLFKIEVEYKGLTLTEYSTKENLQTIKCKLESAVIIREKDIQEAKVIETTKCN